MAKLVACRACGGQVSKDARACPRCGRERASLLEKVAKISVVTIGVSFVIGIVAMERTKDTATTAPPTPRAPSRKAVPEPPAAAPKANRPVAPPEPEPIKVTADQLYRDYHKNEISADERYRNRPLLVTGRVKAITKDLFEDPVIELHTSGMFESVYAHFPEVAAASLSKLSRGQKIAVRCIGNNVVIGMPQLKDCVLQ